MIWVRGPLGDVQGVEIRKHGKLRGPSRNLGVYLRLWEDYGLLSCSFTRFRVEGLIILRDSQQYLWLFAKIP